MAKQLDKVIIIGAGLIGASLGLNLIKQKAARRVIGLGRGEKNLRTAKQRRAIHDYECVKSTQSLFTGKAAEHLQSADIILLATPVQAVLDFFDAIPTDFLATMKRGVVITDVGSTKQSIVKQARQVIKAPVTFVGAHPIAGTEHSGAAAARIDLFNKRTVILTPIGKPTAAVKRIAQLWRLTGARVVNMTAQKHDLLLAQTSHMPHVLAYSLVNAVGDPKVLKKLSAGGFRDISRIASSDAVMWRDICLDNQPALLQAMEKFEQDWQKIKQAIQAKDGKRLKQLFERAKQRRDQVL